MSIAFPPSPINEQLYTFESRTWKFNGSGWQQHRANSGVLMHYSLFTASGLTLFSDGKNIVQFDTT